MILGILILAAAAAILLWRLWRFFKTRGRSACDNCPYAKSCRDNCRRFSKN